VLGTWKERAHVRRYTISIINLSENQIKVYTEPSNTADQADNQRRRDYRLLDAVPLMSGGHEIGQLAVRDLLP
jgi:hypothetical protein